MLRDDHLRILEAVLDAIIPRCDERGMPGAGEAGVADHINKAILRSPELEPGIVAGLSALGSAFADRSPTERAQALVELSADQPGFVPGLLFHTYQGYYESPAILEALDLPPRPPHPKGYEMEPSDLSLLEPVRARGKLYRDC